MYAENVAHSFICAKTALTSHMPSESRKVASSLLALLFLSYKLSEILAVCVVYARGRRLLQRRRIDKEGNVSRFQEYHTSDEEEEELSKHPPYNKYGFVDHPQLQREDQRNNFAPYSLPPQEGNMNGWLTEDANDSDLESMASNQPISLTMKDTGGS
ncbi:hypothetical protein Tco_0828723 [Tanacetum coccineum]